ncbi:MAG TPA: hypothetical protein VHG28_13520 [Longimicrobiaceae bacterium]|nr:hypothetical protein [Longimicrobiaceae bacterium]
MRLRRFLSPAAASLLLLPAPGCDGGPSSPELEPGVFAAVSVDFGAPVAGVRSMSGLLLGTRDGSPPDSLIAPLQPRLWRDRYLSNVPMITGMGARYHFLLSDHWGYPMDGWPRGRPFQDPAGWERFVRDMAVQARGMPLIWDVWNEPDPHGPTFWDASEAEFFQTYLRAYRVLREVLGPEAVVAGPSIAKYDEGFLKRFADFCLANRCEVNVLTWHEMGVHRPLSVIEEHLRTIRRDIVQNRKYAPLKIREIHINEVVGPQETQNPAAILSYLRYLELGGADAAARACWGEPGNQSSCENNTLGGLLTPGDFRRRASWWANAWYAAGADSRVKSEVTDERVASLASRSVDGRAQLLVGYSSVSVAEAPQRASLSLRLERLGALPFAASAGRVRVSVSRVPNGGLDAVPAPIPVFTRDLEVTDGKARLVIEGAERDALYRVLVEAAP